VKKIEVGTLMNVEYGDASPAEQVKMSQHATLTGERNSYSLAA
jgi:hypothetical protein